MTFYATTSDCLRSRLLAYFGEARPGCCGNCSNCGTVFAETDVTLPARKIISCVYRLKERGRSFGKTMVISILRGGKTEKIRTSHCDTLSTYGIMADTDPRRIRLVLDHLIEKNYLALEGDEYPVLALGPRWQEIITEKKSLAMMLPEEREQGTGGREQRTENREQRIGNREEGEIVRREGEIVRSERGSGEKAAAKGRDLPGAGDGGVSDEGLFMRLKELRNRLAQEAKVPAYIVFSDASLRDMCRKQPCTGEQFLNVNGVGAVKLDKYGKDFMAVIRDYGG
jgi:ATP-dependent DNA helicase RecQ